MRAGSLQGLLYHAGGLAVVGSLARSSPIALPLGGLDSQQSRQRLHVGGVLGEGSRKPPTAGHGEGLANKGNSPLEPAGALGGHRCRNARRAP